MFDATGILKSYGKKRIAKLTRSNPAELQEQQLLHLVRAAAHTRFGRDHSFAHLHSVAEYQRAVPLRRYEEMWVQYWKPSFPTFADTSWPGKTSLIAVSSGTTSGTTKYLPITKEMTASNTKAGLDLLLYHLEAFPKSRIFGGKSFVLGGSTDLVDVGFGVQSGDLSGLVTKTLPWWARARYFPPLELALTKDWAEKIDRMAHAALNEDIRMISGVPAWLLLLFEKLFELCPEAEGKLEKIFPKLEMVVHGGVKFEPYLDLFKRHIDTNKVELREVYPASEGFVAVQDRGHFEGMRLMLDHGIFFEFVPLEELESPNPTRHWVKNIETGVNYAIILTTCAGAWSYVLGDTVRFVDTKPPRLFVTGRTSYYISAFGEHLIQEEVEKAIQYAAHGERVSVIDYAMGAFFPQSTGDLGGHIYVVEADGGEVDPVRFRDAMDKRLAELNEDYQAHRTNGTGMVPPKLVIVERGSFRDWMAARGKLGGQNKVPRLINDTALLHNLLRFVENRAVAQAL
jgi:hypothetical protein